LLDHFITANTLQYSGAQKQGWAPPVFFCVQHAMFFCIPFKNATFFFAFFSNFWRLMKPKRTLCSFEKNARSFKRMGALFKRMRVLLKERAFFSKECTFFSKECAFFQKKAHSF
jgi:hypothetical protein